MFRSLLRFLLINLHLFVFVFGEARHVIEIYNKNHQITKSLPLSTEPQEGKQTIATIPSNGHTQPLKLKTGVQYATMKDLEAAFSRKHSIKSLHPKYHKLPTSVIYKTNNGKVSFLPRGHSSKMYPKTSSSHMSGPVYTVPVQRSYVNAHGQKIPAGAGSVPTIVAQARPPVFAYVSESPEAPQNTIKLYSDYPKEFHFGTANDRPTINSYHWVPDPAGPGAPAPSSGFSSPGEGFVASGQGFPVQGPGLGPQNPAHRHSPEFAYDQIGGPGAADDGLERAIPEGFIPSEFFRSLFESSKVAAPSHGFHHHHHEAGSFTSHYNNPPIHADHLAHFGLKPQYAHIPKAHHGPAHFSGAHSSDSGPFTGYYLAEESSPKSVPYKNRHKKKKKKKKIDTKGHVTVGTGPPDSSHQRNTPQRGLRPTHKNSVTHFLTFTCYLKRSSGPLRIYSTAQQMVPEDEMKGAYSHKVENLVPGSIVEPPNQESHKPDYPIRVKKEVMGKKNEEGKPWGSKTTLTYKDPQDPSNFVQVHEYQMTLNRPLNPDDASTEIGKIIQQYQQQQQQKNGVSGEFESEAGSEPQLTMLDAGSAVMNPNEPEVYNDKKKK